MSGLSNFAEEILLDQLLILSPSWIALFTSDPADDNSGTEVSGTGYIRQAITMVRTGSDLSNTDSVSFPESASAWGTVTHCALFDAQAGGNQLINEVLVNPKTIGIGETMTFPIASVNFNLD